MDFGLLGPLEARDDDRLLALGGPKQRTLLAHLLLRANRVVTAEQLIEALWGDEPPDAARNTLQTYVKHLRKLLGPERIRHRSGGYVLEADPAEIDVLRFEALVDEGRRTVALDAPRAVAILREALGLWRGPALGDLADQPSLRPEIARLEETRLTAIEEMIDAELGLGRHRELVAELESLTHRHAFRERLWGHLMLALYRSGRQADALAAYRRARDVLHEELGIDPSPELHRLQEQVLRQDPALDIGTTPLRGYRLLERIGEGTSGTVHRAFQPEVGREVAIKVISPRLANDVDYIRRFDAEAQLVARLEHPHVVPLYDYWREPDAAYLVMRYLRGGSLRDVLEAGPLAPSRAVRMIGQLADALSTAHRQGVMHGDVKPTNVLFDEDGNAYLSDFGIARAEAPTVRTDVHGLGVLLRESLGPDLPERLRAVIERATHPDRDARHADAIAFAAAVREALAAPEESTVPPPRSATRTRASGRSRRPTPPTSSGGKARSRSCSTGWGRSGGTPGSSPW